MTTLDDRIAAHPVAEATQSYVAFQFGHRHAQGMILPADSLAAWDDSLARAERHLTEALDAADRDRAELARLRAVVARVEALPERMAAVVKRLEDKADAHPQRSYTGDLDVIDQIRAEARGWEDAAELVTEALGGTTPDAPVEAGALCPWGTPHPAHDDDCPGDDGVHTIPDDCEPEMPGPVLPWAGRATHALHD